MRATWQRFLGPLTPGVRALLFVLTVAYVTAVFGLFSHVYNLYPWLALDGPGFWKGKVWPLATYGLLPATLLDFLFNWFLILVLGTWLEKIWSRRQLWLYCLVSAVGSGIVKVTVQPSSPFAIVGTTPIVFGLLAAWGRLFGTEKILFWLIWEMTIRQAAIVMTAVGFLVMLPCAGLVNATIMLCGAPAGLLFLWVQSKLSHSRASRPIVSERMGRLEL
jgi:membrane associated rhomboid family serine protease